MRCRREVIVFLGAFHSALAGISAAEWMVKVAAMHKSAFSMHLKGDLNGKGIELAGYGVKSSEQGFVHGEYELRSGFETQPINLSHRLFSCMTITGYPCATTSPVGTDNPFMGKNYDYERTIRFSNGGVVELSAFVAQDGDGTQGRMNSIFLVYGNAETGDLLPASPLLETWLRVQEDRIEGKFQIVWPKKQGGCLVGEAHTLYRVEGLSSRLRPQQRKIAIRASGDLAHFRRIQFAKLVL